MKHRALIIVGLLSLGCGRGKTGALTDDGGGPAGSDDAASEGSQGSVDGQGGDVPTDVPAFVLPAECAGSSVPPASLVCTGLYADIAAKQLAPGVMAYAPAIPLWSDGAEKERWISLPPGTTIDNSDPNEWKFPWGTKAWKQFVRDGHRVETRLWQKVHDNYWVAAAYAWNADETEATKTAGGDIPFGADGDTYHIPTSDECEKCHRGRTDRLLGFDQVGLGLAGASGMTLEVLVAGGRLTVPPASTTLTIGDDGTGAAAPALGWLHSNCGTTCHNGNSGATAYANGMRVRLDASQLDGRSVLDFDALKTTIGAVVRAPAWNGQVRIVPGDPDKSLLYHLISNRGMGNQMPPIASRLVDVDRIPLVRDWISKMTPTTPPPDDAAVDQPSVDDAGAIDVGVSEAPVDDAGTPADADSDPDSAPPGA